jgi:DNA-binding MarR family transcriptional regulator
MLSEQTKARLVKVWPDQNTNIGRLIYGLFRYLTSFQEKKWGSSEPDHLKPGYVSLLANIGIQGASNKELAGKAWVSKQAMSKLVNEMLKEEIIEIEKDAADNRVNNIMLTDKGAELLIAVWDINELLRLEIENHLGKEKTAQLLGLIAELIHSMDNPCGSADHKLTP